MELNPKLSNQNAVKSSSPLQEGGRVKGKVVAIHKNTMEVQVGGKVVEIPLVKEAQVGLDVLLDKKTDEFIEVLKVEQGIKKSTVRGFDELMLQKLEVDSQYKADKLLGKVLLGRVVEQINQGEVKGAKTQLPLLTLIETPHQLITLISDSPLDKGSLVHFKVDSSKEGLQLQLATEENKIPRNLLLLLVNQKTRYHPAYRLAMDYLQPAASEPFFEKAVIDFGRELKESGLFKGDQLSLPVGEGMPLGFYMEKLFNLFTQDKSQIESVSLKNWINVIHRDPLIEELLSQFELAPNEQLKKEELLLSQKVLLKGRIGDWLPSSPFNLDQLTSHLDQLIEKGTNEKLMLYKQVVDALKVEHFLQNSADGAFYSGHAWNEGKWNRIRFKWEQKKRSGGKKEQQVRFSIETETEKLGLVQVDLSLDKKGVTFSFTNEHREIRDLLKDEIKVLEKNLSHLDFKIVDWNYSLNRMKGISSSFLSGKSSGEEGSSLDIKI